VTSAIKHRVKTSNKASNKCIYLTSNLLIYLGECTPTKRFGSAGSRKYLNAAERRRFTKAARRAPPKVRLFCLVLSLSGGRISEILALTPAAIDIESGVANITTLKRRKRGIVRQVPLPHGVLSELDHVFHLRRAQRNPECACRRIWKWSRTTAWRRVKEVMAVANVCGAAAMLKGLRSHRQQRSMA
jgi:integrase/recombinase XerD